MAKRSAESRLLDLVGGVMGHLDLDELRYAMLEALIELLPSRWASLNEMRPDVVAAIAVPEIEVRWFRLFAELGHENPIYQRWLQTRDGRPVRFSDVCSRQELEETRLYQEVYVPLGVKYQIAFTLPHAPDRLLAIALSRDDRDYSDAERSLLDRARPFLIQAYRNALAHTNSGCDEIRLALASEGLTARQAEVVSLIATGSSSRDVGARLRISERTVEKHLQRAYRQLGLTSRSAAAARAWELVS